MIDKKIGTQQNEHASKVVCPKCGKEAKGMCVEKSVTKRSVTVVDLKTGRRFTTSKDGPETFDRFKCTCGNDWPCPSWWDGTLRPVVPAPVVKRPTSEEKLALVWAPGIRVSTPWGPGVVVACGPSTVFVRLDGRSDTVPFFPSELSLEGVEMETTADPPPVVRFNPMDMSRFTLGSAVRLWWPRSNEHGMNGNVILINPATGELHVRWYVEGATPFEQAYFPGDIQDLIRLRHEWEQQEMERIESIPWGMVKKEKISVGDVCYYCDDEKAGGNRHWGGYLVRVGALDPTDCPDQRRIEWLSVPPNENVATCKRKLTERVLYKAASGLHVKWIGYDQVYVVRSIEGDRFSVTDAVGGVWSMPFFECRVILGLEEA